MSQENNFKFNVDILMNDVNNVIQSGINNLLKDFTTNYKLYEETHNCIMNLPSVKREIYKRNYTDTIDENYDDLPDLISMSSEDEVINYTRIPVQDDSDEESDDTLLCMKKVANQLLKEKEETIALYQKEKISYNKIIEKCYKEIEYLKHEIYELKKCINQPVVCDLTSEEVIVEIKQEKENIILHIEENPDQSDELEDEEDDEEAEEDNEEAGEDNDEEEDNEELDDEEVEEVEDNEELDDEEVEDNEEVEDDEEVEDNEEVEDDEEVEDNDDVETENSESDEKSQEELEENEEEELFEIEIDDVTYCTNNEDNGFIYEVDKDGNVGEVIGYLKDGEPFFN